MQNAQHNKRKFLLVDDHTLIRSGLTAILKDAYSNPVINELVDGTGIIEKLKGNPYDLIIMDIQMPNTETLWLINYMHLNYPAVPVLIYSMTPENIYALRVIKAGAKGFVSKESSITELKKAIDVILNGKKYISQHVVELVSMQAFKIADTPFSILSSRELQIVSLLLAGNSVTGISKILGIQNSTVGTHKAKIYQKLKVANLLELKEISDIYQV